MMTTVADNPQGTPTGELYDSGVTKVQQIPVEEARKTLGVLLKDAAGAGRHLAFTWYGRVLGVWVPIEQYRRYRELDGDPTDL